MKDTLLRHWEMLKMIPRAPAKITTTEIHRKLTETGYRIVPRTVQRDLMTLSESFPLQCDDRSAPYGWQWAHQAPPLDIPGMGPQAALAFKLVDEFLRPMLPKSTLAALGPYLSIAEGVLEQSGISPLARWLDKVKIVPRSQPLIPPTLNEAVLAVVYEALFREKRFRALYQAFYNPESKEYLFNPIGLVFRESVIYLVATLWDYSDIKQFALHRMESAKLLDDPVKPSESFDLDEYIRQHEFEYPVPNEPKAIELEFLLDPTVARHLRETPLSLDQSMSIEPDGSVRLRATVANTAQLRWWLLGFGNGVDVMKPETLRLELLAQSRQEQANIEASTTSKD